MSGSFHTNNICNIYVLIIVRNGRVEAVFTGHIRYSHTLAQSLPRSRIHHANAHTHTQSRMNSILGCCCFCSLRQSRSSLMCIINLSRWPQRTYAPCARLGAVLYNVRPMSTHAHWFSRIYYRPRNGPAHSGHAKMNTVQTLLIQRSASVAWQSR